MQKLDQISLQSRGISKEDQSSAVEGDNEVEQLRGDVTERQQADNPPSSHLFGSVDLHDGGGGLGHPGVVIVADHHCLRWAGCAAGVDESGTVAGLLDLHTPFDTVLLLCRLVTVLKMKYFFSPNAMNSFQVITLPLKPGGRSVGTAPFQMT